MDERIAQLAEALANFEGGQLFDHEREAAKAKVRSRALRLLDHRARSESELRQRLIDAEYPPALIDEVLEDLTRSGLIDDEMFALEWVRQRHQLRGKSKMVLDQELKAKGIAQHLRQQALETIDEEDEWELALQLASKKARTIKQVPEDWQEQQRALRKMLGVLARRGFPQSMAMSACRQALETRIDELKHNL